MSVMTFDEGLYTIHDHRTDRMMRRAKTLIGARRIARRDYGYIDVDIYGPECWYGPIEKIRRALPEVAQ